MSTSTTDQGLSSNQLDQAPASTAPADPLDPDQLLSALRFMQTRLKRFVREAADEDMARRLTFAKCWVDSAISRLRMDEELENLALMDQTSSQSEHRQ